MTLFPAVFALGGTRIHVCIINGHNIASNIEAPVNHILSLLYTLGILNIYPNDSYILIILIGLYFLGLQLTIMITQELSHTLIL